MIINLNSVEAEIELEEPNLDKKNIISFKYEIIEQNEEEFTEDELKEALAAYIIEALELMEE